MKNIKNYLIAILSGFLVLTLTTQPSIGASKKTPVTLSSSDLTAISQATPYVQLSELIKLAEYDNCLSWINSKMLNLSTDNYAYAIGLCSKFKP
jgi:hypothetical protein